MNMSTRDKKPIFFHVYFHFENFANPEVSIESIRRELGVLKNYGVKGDPNFFDVMGWMIKEKDPELIEFIKELNMPLGYHAHFLPNPRLARIVDKEWDEAVKMYTESEGWGVEVKYTREERAKALNPKKPGGLMETQRIFGKKAIMECPFSSQAPVGYALRKNFNIRTAVDGGSHLYMRAFPPRRPDRLWNYDEYLGHWTYLYWYVGLLFIKHPWRAFLTPPSKQNFKKKVNNLPRSRWHMVSFCGTDHPPSPREDYYQSFENLIEYLVEDFIPENPGSRFVTPEDLLRMVIKYEEKAVTTEELLKAALYITQNWVGRPPTFIDLDTDFLSLTEVFQALCNSLCFYHENGKLPKKTMIKQNVLGPIGNLEEYDLLRKQEIISGDNILATASSIKIDDRVPYKVCLESKGIEVNPAEFLFVMASEYRAILEEGKPKSVEIDTAHIEPINPTFEMVPMKPHVPFKQISGFSRMQWYTRLQQWTVKPAIIKPEYVSPNPKAS